MVGHRAIILALMALMPWAVHSQSHAERAMLTAWNDSLLHASESAELDRFVSSAKGWSGGANDLRKTLLILRRGEMEENRPDLELVLDDAEWISHGRGDWPWIPYVEARAFAFMAAEDWVPTLSSGKIVQESHSDATWRMLRASLDIDADFPESHRLLTQLMVGGGDRFLRPNQVHSLTVLVRKDPPDADDLLVWGRYQRTRRDYDSALAAFERSDALGGDHSRLALERARTLSALGWPAQASAAYWDGIAHLTPTGREMYHHDLAWILGEDSLAAFDRLPMDSVNHWLQRFWNERDATVANHPGERLEDHLRRWVLVYERYRDLAPWRRTIYDRVDICFDGGLACGPGCTRTDGDFYKMLWKIQPIHPNEIREREMLLDDRGLIYLRHGAPIYHSMNGKLDAPLTDPPTDEFVAAQDRRFWFGLGGGGIDLLAGSPMDGYKMQNEFWTYWFDGEPRVMQFKGSGALGQYAATTLSGLVSNECTKEGLAANKKSHADVREAFKLDSDNPLLKASWPAVMQAFGLGNDRDRSGRALITFAVGSEALAFDSTASGGVSYPIGFRVVAYEPATGRTVTLDTVRSFGRQMQLAPTQSLTATLELPLPAGMWQIAIRANQGVDSIGAFSLIRYIHVDGTDALALSDIVTGIAGSNPWTATDGSPFPVNYFGSWPAGGTAELFYEVRGVAAGASYRTTVEVRPTDPKAKELVRITTTDQSTGPVTRVRKSLGLERLTPGSYQLVVTVESGDHKAVRTQPFVVGPRR